MTSDSTEFSGVPDDLEQLFPNRNPLGSGGVALRGVGLGSFSAKPAAQKELNPRYPRADDSYRDGAPCEDSNPEIFFPPKYNLETDARVAAICGSCAVQNECREYGIETRSEEGYYGGMRPRDRLRLKKRRQAKKRRDKRERELDS